MDELIKTISEKFPTFLTDANLQNDKDNKAAGTRARKVAFELITSLKEFRKVSLAKSKK